MRFGPVGCRRHHRQESNKQAPVLDSPPPSPRLRPSARNPNLSLLQPHLLPHMANPCPLPAFSHPRYPGTPRTQPAHSETIKQHRGGVYLFGIPVASHDSMTELHHGSETSPPGSNRERPWGPDGRVLRDRTRCLSAPTVGSSHEYTVHASSTPDDPRIPRPQGSMPSATPPQGDRPDPEDSTEPAPRRSLDEFWLAPLIVVVLIVWLRLALDALGILPLNLGQ